MARDDVDVVSMAGPNFLHREVGVAIAEAGKHLWIEKPAGRTSQETAEIAAAVDAAGVQSAAGFNYRNAPAVEWAKELVDSRVGWDGSSRSRCASSPTTRRTPTAACPGATSTSSPAAACSATWSATRPTWPRSSRATSPSWSWTRAGSSPSGRKVEGAGSHFSRGGGELGPVENEDYVGALLRFESGARGTLVSSRTAVGEQCTYGIAVHGDRGAFAWDFRRMGELQVCLDQDFQDAAYSTVYVDRRHGRPPRSSRPVGSRSATTTSR